MTDTLPSLEIERAQQQIESFRRRFGKPHHDLACHAALPLFLSPDLLNDLWLNFQRDVENRVLNIPWIAIADLLLSGLCTEVGTELYEMKPAVRSLLIARLKEDPRFGPGRARELSDFLQQFIAQQLQSEDPYVREQAEAQKWTANAYVDPDQVAPELARAAKESIETNDIGNQLRLASIMDALADPLQPYTPFVNYMRQRRELIKGGSAAVSAAASDLASEPLTVGDVELPAPTSNAPPSTVAEEGPGPTLPPYIFGLRGLGGEEELLRAGKPGWILVNVTPGTDTVTDFSDLERRGIGVIVVIENSYGEEGTIPGPSQYHSFANQCADIVRRSRGARIWVIGDEPNNADLRPREEAITPEQFARCYNLCREAIRGVKGHEKDWVIPGAVGPFLSDTQYPGNSNGDWIRYFSDLLAEIQRQGGGLDAIAIHTFSFSQEASAITAETRYQAPFDQNHSGFRAYRDFLNVIPSALRGLPVLITAARPLINGREQWIDQNTGWIQAAFAEIDAWNAERADQSIIALCLARWQSWEGQPLKRMADKPQVVQDLREALRHEYRMRMPEVTPAAAPSEQVPEASAAPEEASQFVSGTIDFEQAVPGTPPIRVSVAHGNLSFCSNPVAVGHYEGDGIVSAEKELDHHLNGRLSARQRLGRYPGPDATAEVFLNEGNRKPGGAIVVGLGKAGELSPRKLTQAFANAMREYGFQAAENRTLDGELNLAVSSLLIGAGGMGLSVANSVEAILNGVLQANKSFSQVEGSLRNVRISEIQFIELYKDQAILAARALRKYEHEPEFAADPLLHTLPGGFERLTYEEPAGWWSRIYVRLGENNTLMFTVPAGRTQSEEAQLGVQRTNIRELLAQAVRNPGLDPGQVSAIWELLIPNRLKGTFRDLNNVLFVLDPEAARYPWEMLYDRRAGQDSPLVTQVGMIRQFTSSTSQERVIDLTNKNILVVGNPANVPLGYAHLPGAEQEARLVAATFREYKYQVTQEINSDSTAIMNSLFANDYRVLHLTGHGVYRFPVRRPEMETAEPITGIVLGSGVFLTVNDIRNKLEIPELVFVNCCHLGAIDSPAGYAFNEFAASLSEELLNSGVKAVIAAGWAVDDAAALTFTDVFYDELLKGAQFGEAVKAARRDTYAIHPRTNTWGAYQCYGDPYYRLVVQDEGESREGGSFVHLEEAKVEIEKLSGRAKTTAVEGIAPLRESLLSLENTIAKDFPAWLDDSRLQEALGEAFAEMFDFEKAVHYYELAVKNRRGQASIRTVEQLVNCRIRLAVQNFQKDPDYYKEAREIITEQITELQMLIKTFGETAERWSMIGSGYKRLAQISSDKLSKASDLALNEMEAAYDTAWQLAPDDPYPLTNALLAKVILLLRSSDPKEIQNELPDLFKLEEEAASLAGKARDHSPDDFWASIATTDVSLVEHLLDYLKSGSTDVDQKSFDQLAQEYRQTWNRYGSARELNSVIQQYDFLLAMLHGLERHQDLAEALTKVEDTLTKLVSSSNSFSQQKRR